MEEEEEDCLREGGFSLSLPVQSLLFFSLAAALRVLRVFVKKGESVDRRGRNTHFLLVVCTT